MVKKKKSQQKTTKQNRKQTYPKIVIPSPAVLLLMTGLKGPSPTPLKARISISYTTNLRRLLRVTLSVSSPSTCKN